MFDSNKLYLVPEVIINIVDNVVKCSVDHQRQVYLGRLEAIKAYIDTSLEKIYRKIGNEQAKSEVIKFKRNRIR